MRIVFFGATALGYECCRELLDRGENVVGIFTIPREFRISYSQTPVTNVTFRSFDELAQGRGVPLVEVTGRMSEPRYAEALRAWQPHFGLVVGWYYMIPAALRELFPLGVAGIHASLLPKYRGGAPLVWAIINGEAETGVSLFYFDGGVDTGDLIAQRRIGISADDTIGTVYDRATRASLDLVRECVPLVRAGVAPRVEQDHGAATTFPQRKPEDGLIDWGGLSARQAYDWVRAQTRPYPGAFARLRGERVTIWRAELPGAGSSRAAAARAPGAIEVARGGAGGFGVWCADGRLLNVLEVEAERGGAMGGAEFLRARAVGAGEAFDQFGRDGGRAADE
jgi:methionyl-tRNA formyltransferase